MPRSYSLAVHDLRVSGGDKTSETINWLLSAFKVPLTIHLIFDTPLENEPSLFVYLKEKIFEKKIEVVFHGLTHQCSRNVSKLLVFYHKYQAEYLDDSSVLRDKTKAMFQSQSGILGLNMGICPPCWISTPKNKKFLKSLNPLYVESLLVINNLKKRYFSAVISLGSPKKSEIFFLKILAKIMLFVSSIIPGSKLRVAIHTCDLGINDSMHFFSTTIAKLNKSKFQAVLLNQLAN